MVGEGLINNNIAVKNEFDNSDDAEDLMAGRQHTDSLPNNLSFNTKVNEKNMHLLADNDAMDAYMKNLCQKYF